VYQITHFGEILLVWLASSDTSLYLRILGQVGLVAWNLKQRTNKNGLTFFRFPLSLRNVEDLLHERRIDVSHATVRFWWNRFGPMFAAEIRRKRIQSLQPLQSGT